MGELSKLSDSPELLNPSDLLEAVEPLENPSIILATLNARYIHSSFGLRYLKANMGDLEAATMIQEFTLEIKAEDMAERLLAHQPKILGFSLYIWNAVQTEGLIRLIKELQPELPIIIGGPEVSYETETQAVFDSVDYVVTGWGDISVPALCADLLAGTPPEQKIIKGEQPRLSDIKMPYHLYTDEDIKNRVIYVEASRGCPYKCEFCLSALDKTAWPYDGELFLAEMETLYQRGVRQFKFVDRTFNLNIKASLKIIDFFLERMDDDLFLHFELIPDHLPELLKDAIKKFPENSLQFEIGIQTFNPEVQSLISRRQKNDKARENLCWLRAETQAYIHADLIFGLPGDDLVSFADSFDQLYELQPHEIQVGILKRLKGSPIIRHSEHYQLRFNPNPPFNVLSTSTIDFSQMQSMNRFARYWDMIANSGRFKHTLNSLIEMSPFNRFMQISNALFDRLQQTHRISLNRLFDALHDIALEEFDVDQQWLQTQLMKDFKLSGLKTIPACLAEKQRASISQSRTVKRNQRQSRHSAT